MKNIFKKFVLVAFVLAMVVFSAPQAKASVLSDLRDEVRALQAQILGMKVQLGAAVSLSSWTEASRCKGTYYEVVTKEDTTYWCEGTVDPALVASPTTESKTEKTTVKTDTSIKTETSTKPTITTTNTDYLYSSTGTTVPTTTYDTSTGTRSDTSAVQNQLSGMNTSQITLSLIRGSYGDQVIKLQEILKSLGYFTGDTGPAFGPKTEQAIKDFQKANGLGDDGKVGPKTREILNDNSKALSRPVSMTGRACLPGMDPWIQMISPNGGETFTVDGNMTIEWRPCNISYLAPGAKVSLILRTSGSAYTLQNPNGSSYWFSSEGNSATITVPYIQAMQNSFGGQNFWIRAYFSEGYVNDNVVYGDYYDDSDNKFTINQ